jgi:hypothetical protein
MLRYVGIGMSVYTLTYPMPSTGRKTRIPQRQGSIRRSEEHHDGFEVVELEPEEACDFDCVTTLEKVSYR